MSSKTICDGCGREILPEDENAVHGHLGEDKDKDFCGGCAVFYEEWSQRMQQIGDETSILLQRRLQENDAQFWAAVRSRRENP